MELLACRVAVGRRASITANYLELLARNGSNSAAEISPLSFNRAGESITLALEGFQKRRIARASSVVSRPLLTRRFRSGSGVDCFPAVEPHRCRKCFGTSVLPTLLCEAEELLAGV